MSSFAVIFDMDGVIVDTNPYHKQSILAFLEKHQRSLSDSELKAKVWGRMNREWIKAVFGEELPEPLLEEYGKEKEAIFREMYAPYIGEVAGLSALLAQLRQQQIPCAVATSAPRANVDFVFAHLGIATYFSQVLDESHVSKGKPHPEVYLKTAEVLGFAPERCIVFEDSLSGIEAGRAAGAKVIGLTTTHAAEELAALTHLQIPHFEGLSLAQLRSIAVG